MVNNTSMRFTFYIREFKLSICFNGFFLKLNKKFHTTKLDKKSAEKLKFELYFKIIKIISD